MQGSEAMNIIKSVLLAAGLGLCGGAAHAATSCSLGTIAGMNIASYTEGVAATPQPMSVVVNCNRQSHPADPSSVNYTLTFDTGLNNNRASATVTGTFSWSGSTKTGIKTATVSFYGCVGAQSGMAAATYNDSIGVTLTDNVGSAPPAGSIPVSITLNSACTVSTPPGTMTFNYTAFRASPLVVPVNFGVTCTNTTPYTMALDTTTGVAAGLAYSLALSATSATGNGVEQTFSITGTMAAGHPGDCTGSCTGANTHNLTVSY
jgi:spore coat protein U-like protein